MRQMWSKALIALYLQTGSLEVWICDADGQVTFHNTAGPMTQSAWAPDFPNTI